MNIQVLVAAMNQKDDSLIKKMNIQTDALIGNQCDICSNVIYQYEKFNAVYFNRPNHGVGLNRNVTLLQSDNDCILTFADDDMVFVNGYDNIVKKAFDELPDADAVVFNIKTIGANMGRRENHKIKKLNFLNSLNYGAARLSVKSNSIKRENITFHTCFGGGTRYGSGEDTLFIIDLLKHKLKIYAYPLFIAEVDQTSSTWFNGYDEKYFHDKGVLFRAISKHWATLLCLQYLIRHKNEYISSEISFKNAYKSMKKGMKNFKTLSSYTKL